jgi:hypothetical protein
MSTISDTLFAELISGWIFRHRLVDKLGIQTGISAALKNAAKVASPPCIVERRHKGQHLKVQYHLRTVRAGELGGQLLEVEGERD